MLNLEPKTCWTVWCSGNDHCDPDGCSDVITTCDNIRSSFPQYSLWSPHCSTDSWTVSHSAAPRGGKEAGQNTTCPLRSPTANPRPGNVDRPRPGDGKHSMRQNHADMMGWWQTMLLYLIHHRPAGTHRILESYKISRNFRQAGCGFISLTSCQQHRESLRDWFVWTLFCAFLE